ncbi:hypothetical protein HCN44_009813 [Aphidius gifuensis]|uniref:Odorant receptor n=1 Tax=Aphidius gifuensis TaxID=684658 RepID=A0A834Y2Y9_APHGI|nr:hypothetical protein HCN44_009813 [Aphidius gifuensis]
MISYLSVSILWCRIMGLLWYSDDNVYNWKRKLYKFYTGLIIFMEITMSLTEFIALFGSFNNAEEFANASFLLVTHICGCLKMINIIVKQNVISKLLSTLLDNNLQPRDDNETKILSIDGGRIRQVVSQIFVYIFAKTTNETFTYSILIQYFVSSIAICSSVFQLTYIDILSKEFVSLIAYIICMTIQIYIYCICGENISSESDTLTVSLYNSEWTSLSKNGKKSLIMMMIRSFKPIQYTCGYIITLSLGAFTSVHEFFL